MMKIMCPKCHHRFPAPGNCCNPNPHTNNLMQQSLSECGGNYYNCSELLVPRDCNIINNNGSGCFINAPTIINGPTYIQSTDSNSTNKFQMNRFFNDNGSWKDPTTDTVKLASRQINTTCGNLTGGTITITTPSIQSGGCLIHANDSDIVVQSPQFEVKPKLSGGGCLVQKKLSTEDLSSTALNFTDYSYLETLEGRYFEESQLTEDRTEETVSTPPSGCQELPGIRRQNSTVKTHENDSFFNGYPATKCFINGKNLPNNSNSENLIDGKKRIFSCCCCCRSSGHSCHDNNLSSIFTNSSTLSGNNITAKTLEKSNTNSVQIQVNATVQLPPHVGQCIINVTATTNQSNFDTSINTAPATVKSQNNFNGGGLIQMETVNSPPSLRENIRKKEETLPTPFAWLIPRKWPLESYSSDNDLTILEMKRLLHMSGWYHEGLSWQQSENLLKNTAIGRWLMRDSSDSRYAFAISVQTERGPISVRVHHLFGQLRLDSQPKLNLVMPLFNCPIRMLEYYVKYSTMKDNRREVWVDYGGHHYSQIYLTQPLVKKVQSLSHLARLVINKNKMITDHLPILIKNYIAEYPYSI